MPSNTAAAPKSGFMKTINNANAGKLLAMAGIGYGIYYLIKKGQQNANQTQQESQVATNQATQQATLLYQAMTPDAFWNFLSSTNVAAIMQVATNITDIKSVQTAYKNLYNRDLMTDLQKNLSTDHMSQFMSLITKASDTSNQTALQSIDTYKMANNFRKAINNGDADTILSLAKQLYHNGQQDYYNVVAREYQTLFSNDFDTDLQNVLDPDQYNQFNFEIVSQGTYTPQSDSGTFNF